MKDMNKAQLVEHVLTLEAALKASDPVQPVISTEFTTLIEATLASALDRQAPIDKAKAELGLCKEASSAAFTTQLWAAFELVGRDFDQFTLQTDKVCSIWKKHNSVTRVPHHWTNMRSSMKRAIESGADVTSPDIKSIAELVKAGNAAQQIEGVSPSLDDSLSNTALVNMVSALPAEVREQVNAVLHSISKNIETCPNAVQTALEGTVLCFDKDVLIAEEELYQLNIENGKQEVISNAS